MKQMLSTCREVRRSLLLLDSLDAVERGFLDMHLKRCPACHGIAEELARIEAGPGEIEAISEERMQHVYRRLTPAVHEISTKLSAPKKPWAWLGFKPTYAIGVAVAVAIALVFVFLFQGVGPRTPGKQKQPALERASALAELPVAFIDRCEGRVRIDGRDMFGGDRFSVQVGTRIEVEQDARFSFHMGNLARVALVGETSWQLVEAQGDRLAVRLDAGKLAMDFNSQLGKILTVATTDAQVQVKGTVFTVEVGPSGPTHVGVMEGLVEVVPRRGVRKAILVAEERFVTVPGNGEFEPMTDVQRSLVAELRTIGRYPEELTRMVRFDGNPQKARVEVDGRVVGTTPLAVRLPEGSFTYKLTAPGMAPVVGGPQRDDGDEKIAFAMLPAYDYQPAAMRHSQLGADKPRPSRPSRAKIGKASKKKTDLFKRARAAMTAGDIPDAIALLRRANETITGRKLVTGLALLAECYSAMGTYDRAADALDRIVDEMPGSTVAQNARYEIGRLAMDQLGDYSRAKGAFTAYVASRVGGGLKEDAYYSLCELDGRLGEHRNALHCFNQFLRSFPGGRYAPSARLWRGALYQDVEGRFAQAEDDLLAFVQARPSHPRTDEARYRIALGRYQNGDKRGAMGMIREYLHHHPNGKYRLRVERLRLAIIDPTVSLQTVK